MVVQHDGCVPHGREAQGGDAQLSDKPAISARWKYLGLHLYATFLHDVLHQHRQHLGRGVQVVAEKKSTVVGVQYRMWPAQTRLVYGSIG